MPSSPQQHQQDAPPTDSCERLRATFGAIDRVLILGRGPSATEPWAMALPRNHVMVTGPTYATRDVFDGDPIAVLIGTPPNIPAGLVDRYHDTPADRRPLLMYTYLPDVAAFDFKAHDLPQPVGIRSTLETAGLYAHEPGPYPTSGVFLVLLAAALGLSTDIVGIDIYGHRSGRIYATDRIARSSGFVWPPYHSAACEIAHLRRAMAYAGGRMRGSPELHTSILEA